MSRGGRVAPAVAVVGRKGSGKTTLIERLIPELAARGLRVAAVKHGARGFRMDREGKDSWRLRRAGACGVAVAYGGEAAFLLEREREWDMEELAEGVGGEADLVLVEGHHPTPLPKVVMVREDGESVVDPLSASGVLAVVSGEAGDRAAYPAPCFSRDDVAPLADRLLGALGIASRRG